MVLDGQPWYVNDGSPEHGNAVLVNDTVADTRSVHSAADVADEDISVPPLLRSHTDPFPRRLDSPPDQLLTALDQQRLWIIEQMPKMPADFVFVCACTSLY